MKEPRRLLEGAALLPPRLVEALRSAPSDPGGAELQALASKLGASLGIAVSSPQVLTAAAGSAAAAKPVAFGLVWWGLGGAAGGVGLLTVLAVAGATFGSPTPASSLALHAPAASSPAAYAPAAVAAPASVAPRPAVSAAPLVESSTPSTAFAARPRKTDDQQVLDAGESEFSLLRRAQAALPNDPGQALALSRVHERTFPGGVLGQEREVLVIDALLRLGRKAEARALARNFSDRHPNSVHGPRVEGLVAGAE